MHSEVSLLASFAAFYEQLAAIKLACAEKRLPAWLSSLDHGPGADQLAGRVQAWLLLCLERQGAAVTALASARELRAYRITQKIMAAVADECLLIDLAWDGAGAWSGLLLEARLFGTRSAGTDLFDLADQLRAAPALTPLHRELASVLLLALRLGFRGKLRGQTGGKALLHYQAELGRLAGAAPAPAFAQAYAWCVRLPEQQRLSPLAPWLRVARYASALLLALSALCWIWISQDVLNQLARLATSA
ncbi:MAG: DotU family type IV/VI secretion system protein [Pseudomonadota bacterium]